MFRSIDALPSTPESPSVALKCTATAVLFQPFAFAAVRVNVTAGPDLSIFEEGDVAVAILPARSVTVTVPFTFEPSVDNINGLAGDPGVRPDNASDAAKLMLTFVLFQPAAFGAGVAVPN